MWELRLMFEGWLDLAHILVRGMRGLAWRFALVAGVAIATFAMITNGPTG